jgi:hypothetical protein
MFVMAGIVARLRVAIFVMKAAAAGSVLCGAAKNQ